MAHRTEHRGRRHEHTKKQERTGQKDGSGHMENLSQGNLDIRLLGTQPSQEGGSPRLIHWLQERSFDPTQPLYTSHGSVNISQRQSCQPSRPVKAPGAEQAPVDHHSQVNWSNDHNQYTLSGSIIYQQLSREGAHIPNVKVLIPRTSVADEQQRKNCHQRWRRHSWEVGHVDCIYHCISHNARVSQICPVVPRCWRIRGLFHPLLINDFFPLHQCVQLAPTLERYYPNTTGMTCNLVVSLIQHAR